jgi:hypothetical protein
MTANHIDFTAEIGETMVTLTHKHRLLGLAVKVTMFDKRGDTRRIPVAYEYLERPDQPVDIKRGLDRRWDVGRNYPLIKIVAGPEVSIIPSGFPKGRYQPSVTLPLLEIIRVQDPAMVPRIGSDFNTNYLLGEFDVFHRGTPGGFAGLKEMLDDSAACRIFFPPDYFGVTRLNNGVIIRHYHTLQDLVITVPSHHDDPNHPGTDYHARFAYQINAAGKLNITEANESKKRFPLVEVVKTPHVKVEIARKPLKVKGLGVTASESGFDFFYGVYEAPLRDIPNQGEIFERRSSWKTVSTDLPVRQEIVMSTAMSILDAGVRFIPVVGDLIDVVEFAKGWHEGRDLYGRKMSQTDILMLGAGVLIPGSISGASKSASAIRQLSKVYGRRQKKAADIFTRLKKAGITDDEKKLFDEVSDLILKGAKVPPRMTAEYVELLNRMYGTRPSIDLLLNATEDGFLVADLQEAYRAYRRGKKDPLSPREWAEAQRSGLPATILRGLLGPDYRKAARAVSPGRMINAIEAPRPAGYTDADIDADLKVLLENRKKLTERLEKVLPDQFTGLDGRSLVRADIVNAQVSQGLLSVLKGNIAEIFAESIKRDVLQEVAKKHPEAFLISGLRIDLLEDGKRVGDNLLFTDDVIAQFDKKGNLQILALFEIKAGYQGGAEATEQIFEWLERRLTFGEGSRIVIPGSASKTLPGKAPQPFAKALEFTFRPSKPGKVKEVTGLFQADQYIVTASGTSHLGINSAQQTAPQTIRLEISRSTEPIAEGQTVLMPPKTRTLRGITSPEMDYLAVQFLAKLGKLSG